MSRVFAGVFVGLGAVVAGLSAGGQDIPQYSVEVVVFEHANPAYAGEVFATPQTEEDQAARRIGRFARLAAEEYQLGEIVGRLSRSSGFAPVIHSGWVHPGVARADARAKSVSGQTSGGTTIAGTVTLYRDRRLHLELDLGMSGGQAPFQLAQRRRIRSQTLHYFDHPRFGVIAIVTPR